MTDEQKHMWAMLRYNPQFLAHKWADEMSAVKNDALKLNTLADEFIHYMIKNFKPLDTARTVKTWLNTYQLPLEPEHIHSFDDFHNQCGSFIVKNINSITVFER